LTAARGARRALKFKKKEAVSDDDSGFIDL
jgi:hypothetical protein